MPRYNAGTHKRVSCENSNIAKGHTIMQQQYKSNFELKILARMQTSQHLGILIGTVVLRFVITFLAVNLVSSLVPTTTATGFVINYILIFAVQVAASILNVGASFIFLKSACGMQSAIGDLFCGFQQDTVKILKIGAVIAVIDAICMIPMDIASVQYTNVVNSMSLFGGSAASNVGMLLSESALDSQELLEAYSILYSASMKFYLIMLVSAALSLILTLPFFPAFYMILDFPNWSAATILKKSFEVMSGNRLRLLMLHLSFIPSYLLSILTCGISLIWVIPYMNMALANFYLDIMAVRNKSVTQTTV